MTTYNTVILTVITQKRKRNKYNLDRWNKEGEEHFWLSRRVGTEEAMIKIQRSLKVRSKTWW